MSLKIVTGKTETAQITSDDDAALNAGILGIESTVFSTGMKLLAEALSANEIKIYDGDFSLQGKVGRILPSTYETVTISNGQSGRKRNDIIAIKYQKSNSGIESMMLDVIEGTFSSGEAVDPSYTIGDMRNGDDTVLFPIYRVRLNEFSIEAIDKLFNVAPILNSSIPIGGVIDYFGTVEPYGYKFANGQSLQKSLYSQLFDVIGYRYSVTQSGPMFLLPDLRERVTVGIDTTSDTFFELGKKVGEKKHVLSVAELADHYHDKILASAANTALSSGNIIAAGSGSSFATAYVGSSSGPTSKTSNAGGGQSHNNIQPSIVCHKIIRVL